MDLDKINLEILWTKWTTERNTRIGHTVLEKIEKMEGNIQFIIKKIDLLEKSLKEK